MDDKELCVVWLVAIFNEIVILACWRVDVVIHVASKWNKSGSEKFTFQVHIIRNETVATW